MLAPPVGSWRTLLVALILCVCGRELHAAAARPNVLFLLADDQRPDTIHALGNEHIRTPHLDRLVREGTTFRRAIVAVPICVASRAEILTGRDGLRNGKDDFGFTPADTVPSWGTVMRDAGYHTGYVGKWHTPGRPSTHGYETSVGLFAGGGRLPLTHPVDWKGMPVTGYVGWVFQMDDRTLFPERGVGLTPDISAAFADAAIEFISAQRDRPFFLHVNFTAPHDPLLMPTGYESMYDASRLPLPPNFLPEHPFDHGNFDGRDERLFHWPRTPEETRGALAVYYAVISHMDEQIGRILTALEGTGQLDNTVIIFSSDHGLALGSHGLRGKQNMYEHSVGVPLLMRGPGIPNDAICTAQCYLRDLLPTVCELTSTPIPDSVEGRSLVPLLRGEVDSVYAEVFAHFRDSQRMIRTQQWKYVAYPQAEREQLFDLAADPFELRDLSGDPSHSEVLTLLRRRLNEWRQERNDPTLE
jgi:arylsulfatase A-like enzyme